MVDALGRGILLVAVSLTGCGSSTVAADGSVADGPGGEDVVGTDGPGACPSVAGVWRLDYACATSAGSFAATVTQTACTMTLTQTDDVTAMTWISSGSIAADGTFTLTGALGFTSDTSCTGTATAPMLSMTCGACTVTATRM